MYRFALLVVLVPLLTGSLAQAASYEKKNGSIVEPILDLYGIPHSYSGPNLDSSAYLRYANLSYADLTGAHLYGADLSGANLVGANLGYAWVQDSNLSNVNLTGANLTWTMLYCVNLTNAVIQDVQLDSGEYVELWNSNLTGANLANQDFSRWVLMGNTFTNADLTNADLTSNDLGQETILINTNLTGAILTGVDFREATFSLGTILPNGQTVSEVGLDPVELGNYLTVDLGVSQADSLVIVPEPTGLMTLLGTPLRRAV